MVCHVTNETINIGIDDEELAHVYLDNPYTTLYIYGTDELDFVINSLQTIRTELLNETTKEEN